MVNARSRGRSRTTSPTRDRDAVFSPCGKYRYALTRRVGPGKQAAAFILLNPSTADAERDDPTVRRRIGFARQRGCGHRPERTTTQN